MNTCDTCRHWKENWSSYDPEGSGRCVGDLVKRDGFWDYQTNTYAPSPDKDREDQIVISNYGSVYTGPKFGCIHWEPKGIQA